MLNRKNKKGKIPNWWFSRRETLWFLQSIRFDKKIIRKIEISLIYSYSVIECILFFPDFFVMPKIVIDIQSVGVSVIFCTFFLANVRNTFESVYRCYYNSYVHRITIACITEPKKSRQRRQKVNQRITWKIMTNWIEILDAVFKLTKSQFKCFIFLLKIPPLYTDLTYVYF